MGACGGKPKKPDEDTYGKPEDELRSSKIAKIWVLGGPGCGKGTQCDKLVKAYGFVHLSSGDLLRAEVASGSEKGKELNDMMQKGQLVSGKLVVDLIHQAMLKSLASGAKGFLIDGCPRDVEQAEYFDKKIAPCSLILYFDVSDEVMMERLLKRGQTSGRVDDNEETIKQRLQVFHNVSEPVVKKYEEKTARIKANGTVDETCEICKTHVDKLLKESKKN